MDEERSRRRATAWDRCAGPPVSQVLASLAWGGFNVSRYAKQCRWLAAQFAFSEARQPTGLQKSARAVLRPLLPTSRNPTQCTEVPRPQYSSFSEPTPHCHPIRVLPSLLLPLKSFTIKQKLPNLVILAPSCPCCIWAVFRPSLPSPSPSQNSCAGISAPSASPRSSRLL